MPLTRSYKLKETTITIIISPGN